MPLVKITANSAYLYLKSKTNDVVPCEYNPSTKTSMYYKDRENFVDEENLIIFNPIYNMLSALAEYPTVPTFMPNPKNRKIIPIVYNTVKKGYYRIVNEIYYDNKFKGKTPISSFSQGKKMKWNSHAGNMYETKNYFTDGTEKGVITWTTLIKRLLLSGGTLKTMKKREKCYNALMDIFSEYFGESLCENNTYKISLSELLGKIGKEDGDVKKKVIDILTEYEFSVLLPFLGEKGFSESIHANIGANAAAITHNTYPAKTVTIDAEFIFDVPDEIYERLKTGPHYATYLDGGSVHVQFLGNVNYTEYELMEEYNYEKISTLKEI